jgi:hypothetical protein
MRRDDVTALHVSDQEVCPGSDSELSDRSNLVRFSNGNGRSLRLLN